MRTTAIRPPASIFQTTSMAVPGTRLAVDGRPFASRIGSPGVLSFSLQSLSVIQVRTRRASGRFRTSSNQATGWSKSLSGITKVQAKSGFRLRNSSMSTPAASSST